MSDSRDKHISIKNEKLKKMLSQMARSRGISMTAMLDLALRKWKEMEK